VDNSIKTMLDRYNCKSSADYKNAAKEIIQEITLLGLSRSGFFSKAAFYGGTALRIFHGLDRFSEDMDFSLLESDLDFDIEYYFPVIVDELGSFGFDLEITKEFKVKESQIQSAFIKDGTIIQIMNVTSIDPPVMKIAQNEKIQVKIEIDINPPDSATYEVKTRLIPIMHSVKLYDLSSLFAGKIHALLCRNRRVKGRDYYDYIWYIKNQVPLNLLHLRNRMIQSGHLSPDSVFDRTEVVEQLSLKFISVDFKKVITDILPFVKDSKEFYSWNAENFINITKESLLVKS